MTDKNAVIRKNACFQIKWVAATNLLLLNFSESDGVRHLRSHRSEDRGSNRGLCNALKEISSIESLLVILCRHGDGGQRVACRGGLGQTHGQGHASLRREGGSGRHADCAEGDGKRRPRERHRFAHQVEAWKVWRGIVCLNERRRGTGKFHACN
eukprot:2454318-Rhodomonas_salina.2